MYCFAKRKTVVDLYPYIRRICDLTTPNLATTLEGRSENRFNRMIPTLLGPWENKQPVLQETGFCLTSDLADRGVRLVTSQPFHGQDVILGYWLPSDAMPRPWYFLGQIRNHRPIGAGFWTLGIELQEFAEANHKDKCSKLHPLAEKLLPN